MNNNLTALPPPPYSTSISPQGENGKTKVVNVNELESTAFPDEIFILPRAFLGPNGELIPPPSYRESCSVPTAANLCK